MTGRFAAIALALWFGSAASSGCREEAPEEAPRSRAAQVRSISEEAPEAVKGAESHEASDEPSGAPALPPGHPPVGQRRGGSPTAAPGSPSIPPGHPPVGGDRPSSPRPAEEPLPSEGGVERPLILEGAGSAAELNARLGAVDAPETRAKLEEAFRLLFTVARSKRDPERAEALLEDLPREGAIGATVERLLAYAAVSSGFDAKAALKHYKRAVELDPGYGEAHYALSFMHVMDDKAAGKTHYDKALELGVPDTRGLSRFYGDGGAAEGR